MRWILLLIVGIAISDVIAVESLEAIKLKAHRQPSLIASIAYKANVDLGEAFNASTESWIDGAQYRHNFVPKNSKAGLLARESAFNGVKHQVLDRVEGGIGLTLGISNEMSLPGSAGAPDPLQLPYAFLFAPHEKPSWGAIRDPDTWDKKFNEWKHAGLGKWKDRSTEMIEVSGPLKGSICTVSFAPSLGWYPVQTIITVEGGITLASVELLRWREFDVEGQLAIVPLELRTLQNTRSGEPKFEGVCGVDDESIDVNTKIPEDLFTISPLRAKDVVDIDERAKMQQPNAAIEPMLADGGVIRLSFLACTTALLVFFLWFFSKKDPSVEG